LTNPAGIKSFLLLFFKKEALSAFSKQYLSLSLLATTLAGCAQPAAVIEQPGGGPPLQPIALNDIPGWNTDHTAAALTAFIRGCKAIRLMPADQTLGGEGLSQQMAGQAGLWQNACAGALDAPAGSDAAAQTYFASYFAAYKITNPALITGYFEPEYPGSKNAAPGYPVPIYAQPADAALANLPRAAIDNGALTRKAPVTAYLTNQVDAFMLQIEGSGRILLPNGGVLRVGFDGQNGQPYASIGRIMVADGDLAPDDVSFSTISAWLKANPNKATALMEQNPRYVFLRPLGALPDNLGAPGALGVPLTAGRSLAVGRSQLPLGLPVFIATTDPLTAQPLDRLVIAQDTGDGVNGAIEADIFFGAGPQAEATAGRMHQPGDLYLLIPRPTPTS
jgi:membrane-bound lytic murein transglycosylase A